MFEGLSGPLSRLEALNSDETVYFDPGAATSGGIHSYRIGY